MQASIDLRNPQWEPALRKLVRRVAVELGCEAGNVKASLYKLLVYGPGDHFLPHRDTEKEACQFGTLVVQLPCVHSGGSLIVRHGKYAWTRLRRQRWHSSLRVSLRISLRRRGA
jgi:hypothetical protein